MTLLSYGLTSDPFPLQASPAAGDLSTAMLIVVASNPNPDPDRHSVTLQYLTISIPVGADGTDLITDYKDIDPEPPTGWKQPDRVPSLGNVKYVFHPNAGQGEVKGAGLNFVLKNLPLNRLTGTVLIEVIEGSDEAPTQQFYITKFPTGWGEVSFRLDNTEVPYQGTATLHWQGPAQATYSIEYALGAQVINVPPGPTAPALGSQGEYPGQTDPPLTLEQTTVFTLLVSDTVLGQLYQTQQQLIATVVIPAPQITSFAASPAGFSDPATQVTLSWQTANVSEFSVTNIDTFTGDQAAQGNLQVTRGAPELFQAQAFGVVGYTGPPAAAQACFGHLVSSPFQGTPNATVTIWTLVIDGNRPVFDLNISETQTGGGGMSMSGSSSLRIWLALKPGVQVADLGTSGAATSIEDLDNATYTGSLPQTDIYTVESYFADDRFGTNETRPLPVGATWGIKFSDNSMVLVWFQGLLVDGQGSYTANFVWFEF